MVAGSITELTTQFPVPVYLINLDRSPERLAHATAQLVKCGAPFTRISAIDGRPLGPLPWPNFDDASYRRHHGKHPAPGEWGCYMSHVLAIKTFLSSSDAPAALILEDDVVLPADLGSLITEILRQAPAWDMVKLAANRPGFLVAQRPSAPCIAWASPCARPPAPAPICSTGVPLRATMRNSSR